MARPVLTFPNMDHLGPVMASLFGRLGCAFVLPPKLTERTRQLGRRLGREGFCQPLNNNIGDIVLALERGASDVIFTAGHDPCRYGFYWYNQKVVVEEHVGREVPFHIIHHLEPRASVERILDAVGARPGRRQLDAAWAATEEKIDLLAEINTLANRVRARERRRGDATRAYRLGVAGLLRAHDPARLRRAAEQARARLAAVPQHPPGDPLRVLLVGAIYEVLEPEANYHIEEVLGALGVEVERSLGYHDLAEIHTPAGLERHLAVERRIAQEVARLFHPDLREVGYGGYGRLTIGHAARARADGYDGIVHLHSFSCMPEIVAKPFIKQISQRDQIPAMTICVEEISSPELFRSRLEAFVDLMQERRGAPLPARAG